MAALLRYSGAAEGDRTMLDALIPAQQQFANALQRGKPSLSQDMVLLWTSTQDIGMLAFRQLVTGCKKDALRLGDACTALQN